MTVRLSSSFSCTRLVRTTDALKTLALSPLSSLLPTQVSSSLVGRFLPPSLLLIPDHIVNRWARHSFDIPLSSVVDGNYFKVKTHFITIGHLKIVV